VRVSIRLIYPKSVDAYMYFAVVSATFVYRVTLCASEKAVFGYWYLSPKIKM
jgi:hypothetical protein